MLMSFLTKKKIGLPLSYEAYSVSGGKIPMITITTAEVKAVMLYFIPLRGQTIRKEYLLCRRIDATNSQTWVLAW